MSESKRRAKLRALASAEETIVHIGKNGISEEVMRQTEQALKARELVKLRVLNNAPLTAAEACSALAEALEAEPVTVIGTRFVLFKENPEKRRIFT